MAVIVAVTAYGVIGGEIDRETGREMRMRRKVEGKSRVEAFDPSRFKGGGLIEGDFTVCVRPTPSPVMHERGGDRPAPDGSGGAVLGVVVAALLFDGGRQESVGRTIVGGTRARSGGGGECYAVDPRALGGGGQGKHAGISAWIYRSPQNN